VTTTRPRLIGAGALLLALGILIGTATGGTLAAFSRTTANGPDTFAASRIFPGIRTVSARDLRDATSGSEVNASDPYSFAGDSLTATSTNNMASGSNLYFEFTMNSVLPAGLAVSGAQFNLTLASNGGGGSGNACFWFAVYSGGTLIGTHGSYASGIGCSTGSTPASYSTAIPEVTSTDKANGLVVRAYTWETGGKKVKIDRATASGSTPYSSFTSYERQVVDTSVTPSAATVWSLYAVDGTVFGTANNSPSAAPDTTKYIKLTQSPWMPSGSTVTAVSLTNVWHPTAAVINGGTLCYSFEVFNGTTSLATHGSAAAPVSCNATTTNTTDNVSLPEVNDATKSNNLVIKLYYWISPQCGGGGKPNCARVTIDQAQVGFTYRFD